MKKHLHIRLTFLLLALSFNLLAADYYWIGGSGDWTDISHWVKTSGGTSYHIQAPTPNDNVIFDHNSFTQSNQTITFNINVIHCKNLDFSGINVSVNVVGTGTLWKIYGGLKLSNLANISYTNPIHFEATTNGNVIDLGGANLNNDIYFNGSGEWILGDDFHVENVFFKSGTFKSMGFGVNTENWKSNSSNTRAIHMYSSAFVVKTWEALGANFSVQAGTSELLITNGDLRHQSNGVHTYYDVTFNRNNANLINFSGSLNFHDVEFTKSGQIGSDNTFNRLIFTKGYNYLLSYGSTQTLLTDLVANGDCHQMINIRSSYSPAYFSKASGTVNAYGVRLEHIHGIGGATFNAWDSKDLGDNVGWNIAVQTARTLYWVGGNGNYQDTTHWSLSSGGPGGECIPTLLDNVIFDQNSGSGYFSVAVKYNTNKNAECHDMTWTNSFNCQLVMDPMSKLWISGSLELTPPLIISSPASSSFRFVSNDMTETIKSNGVDYPLPIYFEGEGQWSLLDSLLSNNTIFLNQGTFNLNNQYVRSHDFHSIAPQKRTLKLTSSLWEIIEKDFHFYKDSLEVNRGTSTIRMHHPDAIFDGYGPMNKTFYNLEFAYDSANGEAQLRGQDSLGFNKVTFFGDGYLQKIVLADTMVFSPGMEYKINGKTHFMMKLIADGNCNERITIRNDVSMATGIFENLSGVTQTVNYCDIRFIHAFGGFVANNSGDLGHNQGWIFQGLGTTLYWVGSTGSWHNSQNWSYTSGGPPGACIPGPYDDVVFDQNSFTALTDTVKAENSNIVCHDMTWVNIPQTPVFKVNDLLNSYFTGSIELIPHMIWDYHAVTFLVGTEKNKTLKTCAHPFDTAVIVADTGSWSLLDTMLIKARLYLNTGEFILNGNVLVSNEFYAEHSFPKILDLRNSEMYVGKHDHSFWKWWQNGTALIKSSNSTVYLNAHTFKFHFNFAGNGHIYFDRVEFSDDTPAGSGEINHPSHLPTLHFNYVKCLANVSFNGDNHMDTLYFNPGHLYNFASGDTQYVVDDWIALGTCYEDITLMNTNGSAYVKKVNPSTNVLLNRVNLQGIHAIGPATYTIDQGNDWGNNNNWNINPISAIDHYWVNGTGSWNDTAHWSYSSNGPSGACIPTPIDDVFFDSLAFPNQDTVYLSGALPVCHDMNWSTAKHFPLLTGNRVDVYGSLHLIDAMSYKSKEIHFRSDHGGNTIRTANHNMNDSVVFNGDGAWTLHDSIYIPVGDIRHSDGHLNTNSKFLFAQSFRSIGSKSRTLSLGASLLKIDKKAVFDSDNLSLNSGQSLILFPMNMHQEQKLVCNQNTPLDFHNVKFEKFQTHLSRIENKGSARNTFNHLHIYNDGIINGENTFDSLTFAAGNTYELHDGLTQIINDYWFIRGNNCWAITLRSTQENQTAYVSKASGIVSGDFINMRDIHAKGNATFYAGAYSTDISNNNGWIFNNGPAYIYGLGNNLSFNLGGTTTLHTTNFNGGPFTTYLWDDGSTADSLVVNQTGWYYVTVTYAGGCVISDSVYVNCALNIMDSITDVRCHGDSTGSIIISIPDTSYQYSYLWGNGDTNYFLLNVPSDEYTIQVIADSGRCVDNDTLFVNEPPPIVIPQSDTAFCVFDSVMLDLGSQFLQYQWIDGYTSQHRMISWPDTFVVKVQDTALCWSLFDTIHVAEVIPPEEFLGADTTLCMGEHIILSTDTLYDSYLWSNGSTLSQLYVDQVGEYSLIARFGPCIISDTIIFLECQPLLELPNVFTPNNDGINDRFYPENQNIEYYEMRIYNRWGRLVYKTQDLDYGWDGKIRNQDAAEGVYFYTIEFQDYNGENAGVRQYSNGTVTLLRGHAY
jgi:gliding motility-associated-like protein